MDIPKLTNLIKRYQTQLLMLLIFASSLFFFHPSLNYYFFQDDWFVLNWVRTGDIKSFLLPYPNTIYWRPLSMPIFFWINYKIFGLNPWGFHLISFSIFLLLLIVVFKLFRLLTGKTKISLWLVFLYAVWPIHFISLSWLATTSYIIATLFMAGSLIFWIKGVKNKKYLFLAYITFLLGLLSHEMALVMPILLITWGIIFKRASNLKMVLPMLVINVVFMVMRLWINPIHAIGDYEIAFGTRTLLNWGWYILWAFNFPESFKELVQPNIPAQSIKVLSQFWWNTLFSSAGLLIFGALLVKNYKKYSRQLIFGSCWFILGLLPFILTPKHAYPLYLSFAGIGLIYLIWLAIGKSGIFLKIIFSLIWIIASVANLQFTRYTHWIVNEQAVSRAYISFISNLNITPQNGSIFVINESDSYFQKENNFVLDLTLDTTKQSFLDQNAIQVIYNNSSLESIYRKPLQPLKIPADKTAYEINPR